MDLGASDGRGPNLFNGGAPKEVRGALLEWRTAARPMGVFGLGPVIPLSQEASRGKDLGHGPSSTTGNGGLSSHPLWLQGYGENEQSCGGGKAFALSPILLRDKRGGLAGYLGLQHRLGDQPVLIDAGSGLEERPHVLLERETRGGTLVECGLPLHA